MSSQTFVTKVPVEMGHAHFFQTIEAFPELPSGPTFQQREKFIRDSLRYQLLNFDTQKALKYINIRECFKLSERKYVDFCLKQKVPGVSFEDAGRYMGYRK